MSLFCLVFVNMYMSRVRQYTALDKDVIEIY